MFENLFSAEVPVLLVGAPGTMKTVGVHARFDHTEVMLTSTLVEEDISGLPYRDGEYDYRTTPAVFRRLHDAANAGRSTVLFLDELDKARRSVSDTLLTLVASRKVGGASLPNSTCIVAAANPPEFGGGDGISDAMISRFAVIDHVPDVHAWAAWAGTKFQTPAAARIIEAVETGEMPIFDMTGDGLNRRITSPRTLAMALQAVEANGPVLALVQGLLTAATASQVMYLVGKQENEVMEKSTGAARRGIARSAPAGKVNQPVRI